MTEFKHHQFAFQNEMMDLGTNHEYVLKPFHKKIIMGFMFAVSSIYHLYPNYNLAKSDIMCL